MNKPQFKSHWHVEILEPDTVLLLTEKEQRALTGRPYVLLAPYLTGQHTVEDIAAGLTGQMRLIEILHLLSQLEHRGYITEARPTTPETVFWEMLGVNPVIAADRLEASRIAVKTIADLPTAPLISALEGVHLRVTQPGEFSVLLVDDYLNPALEGFNAWALEQQHPWLIVKPIGVELWVGPIIVPGKTACWQCLAHRLRANREVETFLYQQKAGLSLALSKGGLAPTQQIAYELAALETLKWQVQGSSLENQIFTLDTRRLQSQSHTVIKRPQCPACGEAIYQGIQPPQPITLQSRVKTFTSDGGHRVITPEQTVERFMPQVSPITGIINVLERVEHHNPFAPVYTAGHNFAQRFKNFAYLRRDFRQKSAGKGMTDIQAKASGIGEAIERYSGLFQGYEPRQTATYVGLGDQAIHPNECMRYSDKQYAERDQWNSLGSVYVAVPKPFDDLRVIEWSPVWSLTHETFKYLPTAYCYYNYPLPPDYPYCLSDSNGTAAGNTLEEAILQGFLELVERDCVALWWYNRVQRPPVDSTGFNIPYIETLKAYYQAQGRDFWLLDLTTDFNIPAFAAVSSLQDQPVGGISAGFGAHFDPRIALIRAVTEHNQVLVKAEPFLAGQDTPYDDPLLVHWFKEISLASQPYLIPDQNLPVKTFANYPVYEQQDLREDVRRCVDVARQLGLEMLVLDHTRPDIGMPVAKVFVPGLYHYWARYAPGRLYDIPVKLGWLAEPRREEELNPISMFV